MKVFIAVPANAQPQAASRLVSLLRRYGHECFTTEDDGWLSDDAMPDPDECDVLVLGTGWDEDPLCCNLRYNAVCTDQRIIYESSLDCIDLRTLRELGASPRREYRLKENADGINVQVKGQWFGLWHTVKTFRDDADSAYARLLAEELIDKLTDD